MSETKARGGPRKPKPGRTDLPLGMDEEGGVDLDECPRPPDWCDCPPCTLCGWGKHYAVHAHGYGAEPGSKPVGHRYRAPGEEEPP